MKRRALGSFCVTNVICSIGIILLFLFGIASIAFDFVSYIYDDFYYLFLYILCIFVALQRLFRVLGCYYKITDNLLCLNYITVRKKDKWYDFMAIGRRMNFSYQNVYEEVSYKDLEYLDFIVDKKINIAYWNKKEIAIKLKNRRYIWIVRNVFSKRQLRELIKCIQDKNSKVEVSDSLKDYLNLT